MRARVPAKVNLALLVGGTDQQGYHELGTIFQAISLEDELTVEASEPGHFTVSTLGEGASFLPGDHTNLAVRAARLFAEHVDIRDAGAAIRIRKRIPVSGGLAGGSADAAATLVACNELWGRPATIDELVGLAAELGSDVPFLLMGETALGTGRGEVLEALPVCGEYHWILALSHSGLSTPAVFREFDRLQQPGPTVVPAELVSALAVGDVSAVGAALTNDLQPAALRLLPTLERTLDIGLDAGALGGIVSGSGPTCAFLADNDELVGDVAAALEVSSSVRAVRRARGPVLGAEVVV